jgi:signal transduction histidine kinase
VTHKRSTGPIAVVRPLSSRRAWQATFHVVAGMFLGATTGVVIWLVGVLWLAGVLSLVEGPTGRWLLPVLYVAVAVLGPLTLLPFVRLFSAWQRERFRALLGVEIAAPMHDPGTGWRRILRPWTAGSTWRQLAYHLLAPLLGGLGGLVVVFCWAALLPAALWADGISGPWYALWLGGATALLLAAPWVARGVAQADTAAARRLLGPSRAEQLAQRVESLARSRADLVAAADTERRRIERDLHDGVQQRLVSLALNLGMARVSVTGHPEALEVIAAAHDEATAALAELRAFVRGLHPAVLNDRGLDAALSGVIARMPLPVKLHIHIAQRCSPSIEAIAYFAVSEALTNVAKHAQASRADVVARSVGDRLVITVSDDGRGGASVDSAAGTGLRGLAQRAAAVDGSLTVVSPPGGPTTVAVYIPCE